MSSFKYEIQFNGPADIAEQFNNIRAALEDCSDRSLSFAQNTQQGLEAVSARFKVWSEVLNERKDTSGKAANTLTRSVEAYRDAEQIVSTNMQQARSSSATGGGGGTGGSDGGSGGGVGDDGAQLPPPIRPIPPPWIPGPPRPPGWPGPWPPVINPEPPVQDPSYPTQDPSNPGGPENPMYPGGPENPSNPGGTENPTYPGGSENPTYPGGPENPSNPGGTENPPHPGGTEDPPFPGDTENPTTPPIEPEPPIYGPDTGDYDTNRDIDTNTDSDIKFTPPYMDDTGGMPGTPPMPEMDSGAGSGGGGFVPPEIDMDDELTEIGADYGSTDTGYDSTAYGADGYSAYGDQDGSDSFDGASTAYEGTGQGYDGYSEEEAEGGGMTGAAMPLAAAGGLAAGAAVGAGIYSKKSGADGKKSKDKNAGTDIATAPVIDAQQTGGTFAGDLNGQYRILGSAITLAFAGMSIASAVLTRDKQTTEDDRFRIGYGISAIFSDYDDFIKRNTTTSKG